MGQELHAAIAELTRDAPYTTRSELYERCFRNADWDSFKNALSILALEGLAVSRPHPRVAGDRIVGLTEVGRSLPVRRRAIDRGRKRREEHRASRS